MENNKLPESSNTPALSLQPVHLFCWTHFWSGWAFISSVPGRPGLASFTLENNNINDKLLKHFYCT